MTILDKAKKRSVHLKLQAEHTSEETFEAYFAVLRGEVTPRSFTMACGKKPSNAGYFLWQLTAEAWRRGLIHAGPVKLAKGGKR